MSLRLLFGAHVVLGFLFRDWRNRCRPWVWLAERGIPCLNFFMHLRLLPSEQWLWYGPGRHCARQAAALPRLVCRLLHPNRASKMIEILVFGVHRPLARRSWRAERWSGPWGSCTSRSASVRA